MCLFQICLNGFALFPFEIGCTGSVGLGCWGCQPSNFRCLHTAESIIADLKNTHSALARVEAGGGEAGNVGNVCTRTFGVCVSVCDKHGCTLE